MAIKDDVYKSFNSKTTEIYTHVSKKAIAKIKNPVDDFFKEEIKK